MPPFPARRTCARGKVLAKVLPKIVPVSDVKHATSVECCAQGIRGPTRVAVIVITPACDADTGPGPLQMRPLRTLSRKSSASARAFSIIVELLLCSNSIS